MARWVLRIAVAALCCALTAMGAQAAADRVALVIGNADYEYQPALPNPSNDAGAMADLLTEIGFEVRHHTNLGRSGMARALVEFSALADQADIAVIYYSGHGMEIDNVNYLIPTDASLESENYADFEAITLSSFRKNIKGAKKLKLIILDACRNNAFLEATRGGAGGMGEIKYLSSGEIVAFSTAPGDVAMDGVPGGLSPYTQALVDRISTEPDIHVPDLFTTIGTTIKKYARAPQEPYHKMSSSLPLGKLSLGVVKEREEDIAYRTALADRDITALDSLLRTYPDHKDADAARGVIQAFNARKNNALVTAALLSKDYGELERAARAAPSHPRADEVTAQLDLHNRIDFAVATLSMPKLEETLPQVPFRHPKRKTIETAYLAGAARDMCERAIDFGVRCPANFRIWDGGVAQVETRPTSVVTTTPAPRDPLEQYLEDTSDAALKSVDQLKDGWLRNALLALGHVKSGEQTLDPAMRRFQSAMRLETSGALTPGQTVALMKMAAERNAVAKRHLGLMYATGTGVDRDPTLSKDWLRQAISAGDTQAERYFQSVTRAMK